MTRHTYTSAVAIIAAIFFTLSACGAMHGAVPPPPSDFGTGPRTSAHQLYVVTLQGADALKARKLYTVVATVIDAKTGLPVTDATLTIGGGMPQHGHGLPTRPRVTQNLGAGSYEISGLRFNMGGWWTFELTIITPAGTDTVTFNLQI